MRRVEPEAGVPMAECALCRALGGGVTADLAKGIAATLAQAPRLQRRGRRLKKALARRR